MDSADSINRRTRGDGMEYVDPSQSELLRASKILPTLNTDITLESNNSNRITIPGATTIYRFDDETSKSIKLPIKVPQGKQFYLVPHLINTKKSFPLKNKEPKFVPFEPYKAAVS